MKVYCFKANCFDIVSSLDYTYFVFKIKVRGIMQLYLVDHSLKFKYFKLTWTLKLCIFLKLKCYKVEAQFRLN